MRENLKKARSIKMDATGEGTGYSWTVPPVLSIRSLAIRRRA